jgi:hypothetical protein
MIRSSLGKALEGCVSMGTDPNKIYMMKEFLREDKIMSSVGEPLEDANLASPWVSDLHPYENKPRIMAFEFCKFLL